MKLTFLLLFAFSVWMFLDVVNSGVFPDFLPGLRLKLLELGYKFRNLKNKPRHIMQYVMLIAGIGIISQLEIQVTRANGRVEDYGVVSRRVVTNAGVAAIANAFLNTFEVELFNFHAMGTGVTAEAVGDTALVTEVETRVSGTQSSPAGGQYRTVATLVATAARVIAEHGILSASTVGTLLDRSQFAAVNLANGDSIQFTYTLTFPAGG